MNVLIVDDDPVGSLLLQATLQGAGHHVRSATNGSEAVDILQHEEIRLVITDWEMPEMDGIELCRWLRRNNTGSYTYIILLTGHDRVDERVQGLVAGADDFITKPFDASELLARLQTAERILSLETRDIALFALAKLAESRDPETGAHLERVMNYSRILSQQLAASDRFAGQIDTEFVRLVYSTSPLHDIGKVGIPDAVLLKPGRLSDEEFDIMKSHTTIGADTLDAALKRFPKTRFLEIARDIALNHHERYDGKGYPNHLKGEQIPLCGRIVAVADVYDAVTSKRVYKPSFTHSMARDIILKDSGTHFDPQIVETFLACESQFIGVRERFTDAPALASAA